MQAPGRAPKSALWRFAEWVAEHGEHPEWPSYIDEPGIWLCAQYPFLAGSPAQAPTPRAWEPVLDGVLYETVEAVPTGGEQGGMYYRCRRSLIEIKTPYKLRTRAAGGDFYPLCHQRNGRANCIPMSYYDQIMGNAYLMHRAVSRDDTPLRVRALGTCTSLSLRRRGCTLRWSLMTPCARDPVCAHTGLRRHVNQQLLPALVDFWQSQVLPAFDERDSLPRDQVPPGWTPAPARKRAAGI